MAYTRCDFDGCNETYDDRIDPDFNAEGWLCDKHEPTRTFKPTRKPSSPRRPGVPEMDALEAAWVERNRLCGEAAKLYREARKLAWEARRLNEEANRSEDGAHELNKEALALLVSAFTDAYGAKVFMDYQEDGSLRCPDGRVLAKPGGA